MTARRELEEQVLDWFTNGEQGISSRALATVVLDKPVSKRDGQFSNWPHDPDDLRRCLLFLYACPAAREHLHKAKALGGAWPALIDAWDELEALLNSEVPGLGRGMARRTYDRMKELGT